MKQIHTLSEYDKKELEKARDYIYSIYEYHYGDSYMKSEIKRLETIIDKLDFLLNKK